MFICWNFCAKYKCLKKMSLKNDLWYMLFFMLYKELIVLINTRVKDITDIIIICFFVSNNYVKFRYFCMNFFYMIFYQKNWIKNWLGNHGTKWSFMSPVKYRSVFYDTFIILIDNMNMGTIFLILINRRVKHLKNLNDFCIYR